MGVPARLVIDKALWSRWFRDGTARPFAQALKDLPEVESPVNRAPLMPGEFMHEVHRVLRRP